jgi:hypothetical protein
MHAYVDRYVNVLATPNHPARLISLFGSTLAVCALVAAAAGALLYLIDDQRGAGTQTTVLPGNIEAPEGLEVVIPVDDALALRDIAGFKPFVPKRVPSTTDTTPKFAVSQADADGRRTGRVAFGPKQGTDVDGITGPIVVLVEQPGDGGADADGSLRQLTAPNTRGIVSTIGCGELVLQVQLFFGPNPQAGDEIITPYMQGVARSFVDTLIEQCG